MKMKHLLLAFILMLFGVSGILGADSLCMRLHDSVLMPSYPPITTGDIILYDGYIYIPCSDFLGVYHLDSLGEIESDTIVSFSGEYLSNIFQMDTLLFANTRGNLYILNISDPSCPEFLTSWVIETTLFGRREYFSIFATDSIFYGFGRNRNDLERFNIENLDSIFEIPTTGQAAFEFIDYPYSFDFDLRTDSEDEIIGRYLVQSSFTVGDSIWGASTYLSCYSYPELTIGEFIVNDTFVFALQDFGIPMLEVYQFTSEIDSLWLIDSWNNPGAFETANEFTQINDTLLCILADKSIYIISISDPLDLEMIASYYDTTVSRMYSSILIDSFLVIPTRNISDEVGIKVFVFPCSDCSGNCELDRELQEFQLDVYPNPFNDVCRINLYNPSQYSPANNVTIYNIQGREVYSQNISADEFEFSWSAKSMPRGVYLVRAKIADKIITKRIVLL